MYGDHKEVTVMVSMLSQLAPDPASLVVKAASHSIEARVLGVELKKSYRKGVGFKVVETAMPVHVLSILKHNKIMYFLPEHKTLQVSLDDSSFVPMPLPERRRVVRGVTISPQVDLIGFLVVVPKLLKPSSFVAILGQMFAQHFTMFPCSLTVPW